MKISIITIVLLSITLVCNGNNPKDKNYIKIENKSGVSLGYSPSSGVKIITKDGLKFKDLNKNGKLDPYEDWRLSIDERAKDLAKRMSVEQISGLMLYSSHQMVPASDVGFGADTYNGQPFSKSNANPWDIGDKQKAFLKNDHLRHILITTVQSPEIAAKWNNQIQAFAESEGLGIPCNTSSDPRHMATASAEFSAGAGGQISLWPDGLAIGATFSPEIVKQFGNIAAQEYRALGITTALSPQIDLGTDPRWFRITMTFSEDTKLTTDMARAYIDGFQTSFGKDEIKDGWGYKSVNAMVKHWPGGGTGEGGRDAHWANGKFGVYPGNNFNEHLKPFLNGAFNLEEKTGFASAVMPYYTISYNQDPSGENVANAYSKYIIKDLLREKYNYDGVVCTDWGITGKEYPTSDSPLGGKPWGVEKLSITERHYIAIMAGMDQFGGNRDMKPIVEAYNMGVKEHGEKFMRSRFEQSAVRLLKNIFRLGLFENPYINPEESMETVGNPEFMKAGYEAQVKSIVMLKNKGNVMPVKETQTVFIPKIYTAPAIDWFGNLSSGKYDYPVDIETVKKYYNVTDDPKKADFALVFVTSPISEYGGYDLNDRKSGGNGYIPMSLQYSTYTATDAREYSIAAGDPVTDPSITNRSYKGKSVNTTNYTDLKTILDTRNVMKEKPVLVIVNSLKPMVFNEFESRVDGILIRFGVSTQAALDIISGKSEPSGLLPIQMPANMETVEKQFEDVAHDMECHKDTEGNIYDFAFGLNWNGIINDARTAKYSVKD
ncbi:MAG: glycoside hydrolase family 3 protein [Prevotella sp.]|jgi:beta-glucosidase|nr:glycoside hydrolase family 3 protein [Prevotella sp.]